MTSSEKLDRLRAILGEMESALVAYSGGVDSTFLLRVAHDILGTRAVAVTALSPSFATAEREDAERFARDMGVRHVLIETRELDRDGYRENSPERCYFCKSELFEKLVPLAEREGLAWVAYGEIADDAADHRPGARAAHELRIRAPLAEACLTKLEIRHLSRELGLPTWDKPAAACLSSRVPYGQEVTAEKLATIERAEEVLRRVGLRQVRVRHHDTIARIETDEAGLRRLMEPEIRDHVARELRHLGYAYVTLDLQGYRTGSLNEVIFKPAGGSGRGSI
ncbi:MAG TPA: ATP-dependent sacrificial sulfur transferase LarE [Planctomycetota bacterium]|nr:ATP-dependent sacrificial sulfur transferase LarE [Planctomycetota bacterium]